MTARLHAAACGMALALALHLLFLLKAGPSGSEPLAGLTLLGLLGALLVVAVTGHSRRHAEAARHHLARSFYEKGIAPEQARRLATDAPHTGLTAGLPG